MRVSGYRVIKQDDLFCVAATFEDGVEQIIDDMMFEDEERANHHVNQLRGMKTRDSRYPGNKKRSRDTFYEFKKRMKEN